ncbi:ABC transporter ATP-binding protein [SAR202 cluster bacterium AD-804-J14_MRT_500m]|nr:ABC transporter ATP-binding protein [SAR202 cluster bacterium AD-804-J14_MRT_500m]
MVEARNLTKYYGDFLAIEEVNFQVQKGEIVGFLGPNGAGKTTTMRIITGFIPPSSGTALVAGYDMVDKSLEARARIGYLPETVPLYVDMTVNDYLKFMGTIRRMNPKEIKSRTSYVIDVCRLGDYRNSQIRKLSKGFRQRVGIAQAVMHDPDVLVMDEPTIGIDPIQVVETRQLIKDLAGSHTVILSTHILPEVSMLCDRVLIIHEGQIVAEDTPKQLGERLQGVDRLEVEIQGPKESVIETLEKIRGVIEVSSISQDGDVIVYKIQTRKGLDLRPTVSRSIISNGWSLLNLQLVNMSLEEIFLKLTTSEED